MFAVCLFVFSAYFERKYTKIYDFQKISSKIVPGLFIMGFSHFLYVIFHFLGPAVVPPTRGPQTSILSRNLRLGSKNWIFLSKLQVCSNPARESHYFCSVWQGLIRAYHYFCSVWSSISKAHSQSKNSQAYRSKANPSMARCRKAKQNRARQSKPKS